MRTLVAVLALIAFAGCPKEKTADEVYRENVDAQRQKIQQDGEARLAKEKAELEDLKRRKREIEIENKNR